MGFVGAGPLYFLIFLILFNWSSRARSFYYFAYICTCLFIMNITKIGYHDSRPYMSDDYIIPYGCSNEYGNPSGHSLFSAGFIIFCFLDVYHGKERHGEVGMQKNWKYAVAVIFTILLPLTICFARLYVGVHSIDQIMYGFLIGVWSALYFHYCLRDSVLNHIHNILENPNSHAINYRKYIIVSTLIFLFSFMS